MSRAASGVKHPNWGGASRGLGTKTQAQRWGKPKTGRNSLKHYFSAGAEQVHMDEEKSINADIPGDEEKSISRRKIKGPASPFALNPIPEFLAISRFTPLVVFE
jgi:hypothetical protein